MWPFSDFQWPFKSSRSTADLQTVVFDRIIRTIARSVVTRAVTPDIANASNRVSHAGLLGKLTSCELSAQIFGLISSFVSNR